MLLKLFLEGSFGEGPYWYHVTGSAFYMFPAESLQSEGGALMENDTLTLEELAELEESYLMFDFTLATNIRLVAEGIILSCFSLVGIFCNIVSLIVLSRPEMRGSAVNCFLQALAVFDGLFVFLALLLQGMTALAIKKWPFFWDYRRYVLPSIAPVVYPVYVMAHVGSVWSTVCVSVERYIAVCHSLRARSLCTYRRARVTILFLTLFSICYSIPRFWEGKPVTYQDPETNETIHSLEDSEFRTNKVYSQVYHVFLHTLVFTLGPFIILAVLNFEIWKAIRQANFRRQSLTSCQKNERQLTYMLFCVVLVFFACNVWTLVVNIFDYCDEFIPFMMLKPISTCLLVVNSSVNFFIYCIYCNKFRTILLRMFRLKRSRRISSTSRTTGSSSRSRGTLISVDIARQKSRLSKTSSSETRSSILQNT